MSEKLDIGCGRDKDPEFFGIDINDWPGVDLAWDLEKFPWPIEDNSFSYIKAIHVVEHINAIIVGTTYFLVLYFLYDSFGVEVFPLALLVAVLVSMPVIAKQVYPRIRTNFLNYEKTVMFPAFGILILINLTYTWVFL